MEALTDGLTGLFNRRGWTGLLAGEENRCHRYGHSAGVIVVDLDELKLVNDSTGHFAGDELLARAASVMSEVKRGPDILARVGGDEFTLLAVECDRPAVVLLAKRLREALRTAGVQASLGHAVRVPSDGLQRAWEEADKAMYADKERSRRNRSTAQRRLAADGGEPSQGPRS